MKTVVVFTLSIFLLIIFLSSSCAATTTMELAMDLAAENAGLRIVRQLQLSAETSVSLTLRNVTVTAGYDVLIRVDAMEVPSISIGGIAAVAGASASMGQRMFGAMRATMDSVEPAFAQAVSDPASTTGGSGSDRSAGSSDSLDDGATTIRLANITTMRQGQELVIVVRRRAAPHVPGPSGRWSVSLGFGFPILFDGDHEYFARRDSGRSYTITEQESDEMINLIPALFFNWVPHDAEASTWSWSLTGGLGYDFKNAVVFAGASATFHRNITFAAGIVAHHVSRLNHRYHLGEVLGEGLDPEQLVQERYTVNPFVAISFRLSENLLGN